MATTCIYGLYDPRWPSTPCYVGKGLAKRASHHWKRFVSTGKATNAVLRHWFEKLKADGVEPIWKFLEEDVPDWDWQVAERAWIYFWRLFNPQLCNVADGGNEPSLESSRLGGKLGKGRKNSLESRLKLSLAKKGKTVSSMLGKKHSLETKQKMSVSAKGREPWCKGKKLPEWLRKKIGKGNKGKVRSSELRARISASLKGNIPWNKGRKANG